MKYKRNKRIKSTTIKQLGRYHPYRLHQHHHHHNHHRRQPPKHQYTNIYDCCQQTFVGVVVEENKIKKNCKNYIRSEKQQQRHKHQPQADIQFSQPEHQHQHQHLTYHQYRQLGQIQSIDVKHLEKITNNNNNSNCHLTVSNCLLVLLCHLLWLMLLLDMPEMTQADWLMDCGDCHCKWNSGKKTADCKNLTLTAIPENLSNEVQVLDLSYNRIVYLEQNAFLIADLQNLHKLYIRNSSVQQINSASFTQLEILIELDLSNNLLRSLAANLFGKLVKVRAIILNGNLLENLMDGVFQNLKYLHKIELKDNRLLSIGTQAFVNVPLLSQIYLNNNRLSFLRKESFEMLKRLTALSLDGNLWNCTCELQVFRDFVLRRNLYTPPTDCHYPVHLRGMLWVEDQPEAFACRPRIIFPSKGASINTSKENVTLVCRIHASPNTHITWDYNKQLFRSSNSGHGTNSATARVHIQVLRDEETKEREFGRDVYVSRLTIVGAEKSDEGLYTCLAENAGGKDSVQMSLLVQTSPTQLLFHGNLAVAITLMALALLSVSIFLGTVTCCIYKRFIATAAARQNRHHHLDLSGADPMSSMGTVVANHGTTTDVMLGVVNGMDDTNKYNKKHHLFQQQQQQQQQLQQQQQQQQQTTLNGGTALSYDKKCSELTMFTNKMSGVGDGGGGGGGGGIGGGSGVGGSTSPLLEMDIKTGSDMQLGHAEKTYLAQSNEDLLHTKYNHIRLSGELNRTLLTTVTQNISHNNEGKLIRNTTTMPTTITTATMLTNINTADFQPDLLPAYVSNKINNQQQTQPSELYSPAGTPGSITYKTIKPIENQQQSQFSLCSNNSPVQITATATTIGKTTMTRSKYNASAQEYLQAKYGTTKRVAARSMQQQQQQQQQQRDKSTNIEAFSSSSTTQTLSSLADGVGSRITKSLTMPQRTVCSATTIATPTDTSSSYEYRQPPPPPYSAAHRTAGNLLMGRRDDTLTSHKYNHTKDQGYRETISTCYDMGRATIVTASPSLNFPTTTTGYNNSNTSPRRQLL